MKIEEIRNTFPATVLKTIYGQSCNIPGNCAYAAIDESGDIYGYEEKPKLDSSFWLQEELTSRSYFLGETPPVSWWKESLLVLED